MESNTQETAREMFKHEHTRWNQNTLLFLGILGAILLSLEELKKVVQLKWIFIISALVSFLWLCAIIANRRSSYAWLETIKALESKGTDTKIFTMFDDQSKGFNHFKDLFSNFGFTKANGSDKRKFTLLGAVSRIYVAISLVFIVVFCLLTYIEFTKDSVNQDLLDTLGRKILINHVSKFYPDAKIIDAVSSFNTKGDSLIQLRIEQKSGQQFFLNWTIDSVSNLIEIPSNP